MSGHAALVQTLILEGCDLQAVDLDERSCLHWAASAGQYDTCAVLIKYGAFVNARDKNGTYPVHEAAFLGRAGSYVVY
jgi:26S proteasome non-ATPase regulatory subunit 10